MEAPRTIDEYINKRDADARLKLTSIRDALHQVVPSATEAISYGMPTFKLHGKNLLHFASFKNHIGLYATPDGHAEFEPELSRYKRGKGSVQFPVDQPVPLDLIQRIAIFRADQIRAMYGE